MTRALNDEPASNGDDLRTRKTHLNCRCMGRVACPGHRVLSPDPVRAHTGDAGSHARMEGWYTSVSIDIERESNNYLVCSCCSNC